MRQRTPYSRRTAHSIAAKTTLFLVVSNAGRPSPTPHSLLAETPNNSRPSDAYEQLHVDGAFGSLPIIATGRGGRGRAVLVRRGGRVIGTRTWSAVGRPYLERQQPSGPYTSSFRPFVNARPCAGRGACRASTGPTAAWSIRRRGGTATPGRHRDPATETRAAAAAWPVCAVPPLVTCVGRTDRNRSTSRTAAR